MTYDARERSADQARPVELYEFRRDTLVWRFTSADRDYTHNFQVYQSAAIRRGELEQASEVARANLKLTLDPELEVVTMFRAGPPSDPVTLTVRQVHEGDPDAEAVVVWTGRILSVTTWRNGQAEMMLEPLYTSLRRTGLRRLYQKQCPHVLYGASCGVSAATYRVEAAVLEVNGANVVAAAFGLQTNGYWEGGVLEWQVAPNVWERRFIFGHNANTLELSTQPIGLAVGTTVRVYPGCDHTLAQCHAKFNNAERFGGFPFIPTKNPYGSDPIF